VASIQGNLPKIFTDAIDWFNGLKEEDKSLILAKINDPNHKFTQEQNDNLTTIALFITDMSSRMTKPQIITVLSRLQVDEVYSALVVDKILTQPALAHLDVRKLNSLSDEKFKVAVNSVIIGIYIENNPLDKILSDSELSKTEFEFTLRLFRSHLIFPFIRGELSPKNFKSLLVETLKMPNDRADFIIQLMSKNKTTIMNNFIFRNTQDTYLLVQNMQKTQAEVLSQLQELVRYIKTKMGDAKQGQPKADQFFG
jgi:hypothetical protein